MFTKLDVIFYKNNFQIIFEILLAFRNFRKIKKNIIKKIKPKQWIRKRIFSNS